MFGFVALIVIFIVAAIVAVAGFWLLIRGAVGNGKIEIDGWGKVDAPMGGLIVFAALVAMVAAFKFYEPQVQAENNSLTADKKRLEAEIGAARTQHDNDLAGYARARKRRRTPRMTPPPPRLTLQNRRRPYSTRRRGAASPRTDPARPCSGSARRL